MAVQFKRVVVVDVAGLKIQEPRINGEIVQKRDSQEETGTIKIYNLKRSTHKHIYDRRSDITVDVGYAGVGQPQRIFEGVVQRVDKMREDNAFVTSISLGDVIRSKETRGGTIEQAFEGENIPVREIAPKIVKEMGPNIEIGSLDNIPSNAVVTNFIASGNPGQNLQKLLDTIEGKKIRWYSEGNVVRFSDGSKPQSDVSVRITKTKETGLIGVPDSQEEDRVKIEMLLDPRIRIGGEIVVKGSEYISENPFTIMGVAHSFDNWKGRFVTMVDAVPPDHEEATEETT